MLPFSSGSILLAPMVGITNRAFRTLLEELGSPDYAFTEMASAEAYIANAPYESDYTDSNPKPDRTSVQFYSRSAASLAAACSKLRNNPFQELPAGVDINFGCSAPHIRSKGGGSAWSSDPDLAAELVSAARAAWPGILSAKIRMGPDEDYDRLLGFCRRIAAEGLDFLCLHPRRDDQKFKGKARHEYSLRLARDLSCPLVANGDITEAAQISMLTGRQRAGAAKGEAGASTHTAGADAPGAYAVMIGREAVRKPWIFSQLHALGSAKSAIPTPAQSIDRLTVGLRFLALAELYLPEAWQLESARRFFSYYCEQFSFAHHIKFKTMNSPSLSAMAETFTAYFGNVPEDRYCSLDH